MWRDDRLPYDALRNIDQLDPGPGHVCRPAARLYLLRDHLSCHGIPSAVRAESWFANEGLFIQVDGCSQHAARQVKQIEPGLSGSPVRHSNNSSIRRKCIEIEIGLLVR